MSAIQVANIVFETTGNTRIQYQGTNNYTFIAAGSNVFSVNSSTISVVNSVGVIANGGLGTAGQALTTNGTGVYWSTIVGTNTDASYTWTNTHTFSNTITFNGALRANTINASSYTVGSNIIANTTQLTIGTGVGFSVNGSVGTANQVLTSNGTGAYWASAGASGATLNANNTDSVTYYIGLANTTSGAWTNAVVSNTKLYFVPSTGTLSATIFNSLSDETQKTDIQTINNALDIVSDLRGVRFTWKETGESSTGVIAQEVEKVLPELVTNKDGLKSVNYDGLIGVLIESIKELKEEIKVLKQEKTK